MRKQRKVPLERWKAAVEAGKGYLRPLPKLNLDLVFLLHYERRVKKDGTFQFHEKEYKLRQCADCRVTVCLILQKKILVAWNGQRVGDFAL